MATDTNAWYSTWFDTPFYHILYKNRDAREAQGFMQTLTQYLKLPKGSSVLDLACGRGRHAQYLSTLGYDVTGVDLSENSIRYAQQFEQDQLRFVRHDMRVPLGESFDAVFNLFTSFGYFENQEDNVKTIKAIKANLKSSGVGVIDFMNTDQVIGNLRHTEHKTVDGITFHLKRYVSQNHIIKEIVFHADGQDFAFEERVKILTLADFEALFAQAGVRLLNVFGDYELGAFSSEYSPRLILIFK